MKNSDCHSKTIYCPKFNSRSIRIQEKEISFGIRLLKKKKLKSNLKK